MATETDVIYTDDDYYEQLVDYRRHPDMVPEPEGRVVKVVEVAVPVATTNTKGTITGYETTTKRVSEDVVAEHQNAAAEHEIRTATGLDGLELRRFIVFLKAMARRGA
jgi:hypothetical protein